VDNGSPFAGTGALGLSRLSVWWMRLGIRVEFTRRGRPGDNAGHEQFHGCYQQQVVAAGAAHRRSMQQRSTRWLAHYNQERPHEALGQRVPAQVYRPSRRARAYLEVLAPLKYPRRWEMRRVRNRGHIKWRGRLRFIGRAFVGQTLGLKCAGPYQWEVYLGRQIIGQLHARDPGGLRPARWLRQNSLKV
jgi:putative transposase